MFITILIEKQRGGVAINVLQEFECELLESDIDFEHLTVKIKQKGETLAIQLVYKDHHNVN